MSMTTNLATLELEAATLNQIIEALNLYLMKKFSKDATDDGLHELKTSLNRIFEELDKGNCSKQKYYGAPSDVNIYFECDLYSEIYLFLSVQWKEGRAASYQNIKAWLCMLPKYKSMQANTLAVLDRDVFFSIHPLQYRPIEQNINELVADSREREIKNAVSAENLDKDYLRSLLNDEPKKNPSDAVKAKLNDIMGSDDPIIQALIKAELSRNTGMSQQLIDGTIDLLSRPQGKPPTVITGEQFLRMDFGTSGWIYPELIPDNGVILLSGLPGSMKSMMAYHALFCYLAGMPFLGEELSKKAQEDPNRMGLIINADQQAFECQTIARKSQMAKRCDPKKWHVIGGGTDETKWSLKYLPALEKQLQTFPYKFLVVDSYAKIHEHLPMYDENRPSAALGMNEFQRLAQKYGCTVLMIHHDGKSAEGTATTKARGSTAITGAASGVMNLTRTKPDKNGNCDKLIRFLEISKFRNAEEWKHGIRFNPVTYGFELLPDTTGQQRVTLNQFATNIFNTQIRTNPSGVSFDELVRHCHSVKDRAAFCNRMIAKLEMRGMIEEFEHHGRKLYRIKSSSSSVEEIGF